MKVAFINPPVWHLQNIHYRLNRPLGGPVLCAVLNRAGHEARFIDAEALQWHDLNLQRFLKEFDPDVVATTVLFHNREACRQLAQISGSRRLIAGGPYAATNTHDVIGYGYSVCTSEGELAIESMLEEHPLERQEGVRMFLADPPQIDNIPIPDYDACTPGDDWYVGNEPRFELPEAVSLWTRDCPYNCIFCSNPIFKGKVRMMSPERVYDELSVLKKRHMKHIFVYSDTLIGAGFNQDAWLEEVCARIAPLRLSYKTQGRCSRKVSLSTLQAMKAAGFRAVMWGIESMSPKVLKNLRKGIEPLDISLTLQASKQAGLLNWGFFMVGGIDETEDDFQATLQGAKEFVRAGLIDFGQVSIMTAEPGSDLWQLATDEGWLPAESPMRSHFQPYLNVPWASHEELLRRQRLLSEVISQ